jgi:hypothetical protein
MTPPGFGDRADSRPRSPQMCMPTLEENMQSVRTFAEEVFGNKNLRPTGLPTTSSNIKCSRAPRPTRRVQSPPIAFIAATADMS